MDLALFTNKYGLSIREEKNGQLNFFSPNPFPYFSLSLFLRVYGPRRSRGPYTCKNRSRPISSHLGGKSLVGEGFIIWLSGKFFSRDTAGSPERARLLYLARSGSQSQHAIWFILPAHGASHVINGLTNPHKVCMENHRVAKLCKK